MTDLDESTEDTRLVKSKQEMLQYTQEFWSKIFKREITMVEAREIQKNMVSYFKLLIEWDLRVKAEQTESPSDALLG